MRQRVFDAGDQEAFAALSGDRNPMHMDPVAARRTQAGACAVHGIAATLWALEALAAEADLTRLANLKVEFQGFVPVGAPVALVLGERTSDRLRAQVLRDGARAIALDLRFGDAPAPACLHAGPTEPVPAAPVERRFEELEGAAGSLAPPDGAAPRAAALYPGVVAALGAERVVALALTSTVVGMVAPGLHSIFSGLSLAFPAVDGAAGLAWAVGRADERFRLATIEVAGPGLAGSLRAFVRFPPVAPPSPAAVAGRVPADAFAGRHALVIGGSRGLGAAMALLFAAGGGEVTLTWRSGQAEAEALAAAIVGAGGRARAIRYDTGAPAAAQLAGLPPVTDLHYFATGAIFGPAAAGYRRARLDAFLAVYADGFADAVEALLAARPDQPLSAFYPSSVAVESRPAGMTEYAMAKAAGEILAADLGRGRPGLTVRVERLPRILTDQTATVPPVPAADPVEVMAGILLG
jgi:NAD(P)-dependent dehydrogenase (short-subunit alcohol dehydrogenase family)